MKKNDTATLAGKSTTYILLTAMLIIMMFPLIYTLISSFKTNMELLAEPANLWVKNPTMDNYIQAWKSDSLQIGPMLFNSTWYTLVSVALTLLTSTVCGYVFARGKFKLKKVLFAMFTSLMFIQLGSITIYPLFEILTAIKLNRSLLGLVVVQCFGIPVVNMYLVREFVEALPKELDESATIDGCTFTGTFFRIILPLLKPVIATIGILSFQDSWNSYLMPAIFTMSDPAQQTLIVGIVALKNSGAGATSWNLMLAGSCISIVPLLIFYVFASRYFTSGIVAGAVKG